MVRAKLLSATLAAALVWIVAPEAIAQEHLDDRLWVGGVGTQQWQADANWNPAPFPNDPDRMDPSNTTITDSVGANLSVGLAGNLTVNVGATNVTVASLTIGGTAGAVTTNIASGGAGRLVFENYELNDDTDPDNVICAFNCGAALITSQGAAGATNTISAIVGINDSVDITGSRPITLSGGIAEMDGPDDMGGVSFRAVSPNTTVLITGNITTLDIPVTIGDTMQDIPMGVNNGANAQGTIDISGVISGAGRMSFGSGESTPALPLGQVILRGTNTYTGRTIVGRGNIVLANNSAFGTGDVKQEGPAAGSLQTGYNFLSDSDTRTIANEMIIGQWQTVKGDHSLTWSGRAYQDNARGWINVLPAGKTLTLSGPQFPNHTEEMPPTPGRTLTFDGSGRTVISGGLHDEWSAETMTIDPGNFIGSFRFRGTGSYVVSGASNTYSGDTIVDGGNVHFATNGGFGNTVQVVSSGGAVGVDAGVVANSDFLGRIDTADHGGLMLGTSEYSSNLDFTTGSLANAANMSLAAHENGSTYSGTITPAANTYRLGGGSGTLTLAGANQLTGARNVVATNGGNVNITGSNNYTGTTSVVAKYMTSLVTAAERDTVNFEDDDLIPNDQRYVGTTLTATTLANGGAASSIGSAANAASNLYIQGSTLRYVGGATSTDRLFTIGSGGATIDASGTGALSITNTGALGVDIAEQRTGNVDAFATGNTAADRATIRNLPSTEDLQLGMPIMSPDLPLTGDAGGIPAGAVISRIISPTEVGIDMPVGSFALYHDTPITFGPAPERTLTLTGSNTGNNTLASVIPNASDEGVVGVTKSGDGRWVLSGTNTYTGTTSVEGGILSTTSATVFANASDVSMTSGGVLNLNFSGTDVIDELFFNGIVQDTGTWGAIGNAAAMHQSAFFTGSGLLQVSTATVVPVPGDYNANGVVDAADYVVWRNGGPLENEGEGISPGVVDEADYAFWRSRFGATAPGGGAGQNLATAVPEPGSGLLALLALAVVVALVRSGKTGLVA